LKQGFVVFARTTFPALHNQLNALTSYSSSSPSNQGGKCIGGMGGVGGLQLLFLTQLKCLVHAFIHIE